MKGAVDVRVVSTETTWLYPEMRDVFEKISALRDEVWEQCRTELGDNMPEVSPETGIAARIVVRDPVRRAEIIESYRRIAAGYEAKMADLVAKYTVPGPIIIKVEGGIT